MLDVETSGMRGIAQRKVGQGADIEMHQARTRQLQILPVLVHAFFALYLASLVCGGAMH